MRSLARRLGVALPAALAALLAQARTAHAEEPWVNVAAGPVAREIQPVYWIMFFFAVIVLIIVDGGLIYAAIKFRDRPGRVAKQFHGHHLLELTWTVIPAALVLFFTVISFQRLQFINDTVTGADMTVQVEARQFAFAYQYPREERFRLRDGTYLTGAEELNIPVGKKVRLQMTSPDVIHSFFVPTIGGKKDVVPGRTTELWVQADRPGVFRGQCAEFCGLGHADMLIVLRAHDEAGYARWARDAVALADLLAAPETKRGRDVFMTNACVGCHTIKGTPAGGRFPGAPELTKFAAQDSVAGVLRPVNYENVRRFIENPQAVKPGTRMPLIPLTPDDLDAVVRFLLVLR